MPKNITIPNEAGTFALQDWVNRTIGARVTTVEEKLNEKNLGQTVGAGQSYERALDLKGMYLVQGGTSTLSLKNANGTGVVTLAGESKFHLIALFGVGYEQANIGQYRVFHAYLTNALQGYVKLDIQTITADQKVLTLTNTDSQYTTYLIDIK